MVVTTRQLNRATLDRQLLLGRTALPVDEAVRRTVALQAQEPASPYLALWNRLAGFVPADLTAAFTDGRVIKAPLMRITLQAVHRDDYPAFRHAMASSLRASRVYDRRFRGLGLTPADADALIPDLLAFTGEPRSNADLDSWARDRLGELPPPGVWWALRTYGPFVHAPAGTTWTFGPRPAYAAGPVADSADPPDRSIEHLIRRYLAGFGPAGVVDIAQFTLLKRSVVRAAVAAMAGTLRDRPGPDGVELLDLPDLGVPDPDTPAPARLLGMWDSLLLAHADRSRHIPPRYRSHVIRRNGDVLPTLLVDGHVAGVWRATENGIEAGAFEPLTDEQWAELDREGAALTAFLADRDPLIYRRFGHWWAKGLPIGQSRTLG
ncbi:winged helix DNA-binding domain-containing protein [Nakamurella sp.]|uniref:winged helix DNA-binding domain-containing protein n=1 Tax=Nakamurella sp. TaxID=1869182 RepID=UPI0037835444